MFKLPITYMLTDENIEPLCPSQLITGRRIFSLPNIADGECADEVVSQESLRKRMKYINSVLQHCITGTGGPKSMSLT